VLIDVAGFKGVDMLGDNYEITVADLEGAIRKRNITFQPGDAIIIYTASCGTRSRPSSALRTAPPSRKERPPLRAPSRLPAARLTHYAIAPFTWSASRPWILAAAIAAPKIPNTGPA
jgi:hypothetical protein